MAVYFLDNSALVKRYIHERGSAWLQTLCQRSRPEDLYIARIAGAEVVSAIARRGRAGHLSSQALTAALDRFQQDFASGYEIIEISPAIIDRAMSLARTHFLRGYDAVQLAIASGLHLLRQALGLPILTLVSADTDLNAAATAEGLGVENPNNYP
ncbi:MAG: type II toxin-antitoxin system VapC family toxin [Candidatus Binatia bacterium]